MRTQLLLTTALAACSIPASAGVMVYAQDLAGFLGATGPNPVRIDFDTTAAGSDISGLTMGGVEFVALGSPLIVVNGADTFTPGGFTNAPNPSSNSLIPTTGRRLLSPGGNELSPGPNAATEEDSVRLLFGAGVRSFGVDVASQSADGVSYLFADVYDTMGAMLFTGQIPISNLGGGGAPAGTDFWGIMATGNSLIGRVDFRELDNNARHPDSNVGYDSIRFQAVPEPGTFALIGGALVALGLYRRKA